MNLILRRQHALILLAICLLTLGHRHPAAAQTTEYEWAKTIGGNNVDQGYAIAMDTAGNSYITGSFIGTADFDPGPSQFLLTASGNSDIFLAKYDTAGHYVWAKKMGGAGSETGNDLVIDTKGNICLIGGFNQPADFDPGASVAMLSTAGGQDIFIAKYDAQGNYIWAKNIGGYNNDLGTGMGTDAFGNVYITGFFFDAADFDPGAGVAMLTAAGTDQDVFVAKYDLNGNYLWARRMGGIGYDAGADLAVDAAANIYVTGSFDSPQFNFGTGNPTLSNKGTSDIFLAKYNSSGTFIWGQNLGGTSNDNGTSVAVDGTGSVYLTGHFMLTANFDPDGKSLLNAEGNRDVFIAKYSPAGKLTWAKSIGGAGVDLAWGITVDASSNVYATGCFTGTIDADPGPAKITLSSAGREDVFLAKYDPNGNYVWARSMGGSGMDYSRSVTTDPDRNVLITGYFTETADFNPGPEKDIHTTVGNYDVFVLKMSQVCQDLLTFREEACDSFAFRGKYYKQTGLYADTFISRRNCDSIVLLDLLIKGNSTHTLVRGHYCDSVVFDGLVYTRSGTYHYPFRSAGGCDSNITYELSIGSNSFQVISETVCNRFSIGDSVYLASGIYFLTLPNASGCDSALLLYLIIKEAPVASIVQSGNTLVVTVADQYQWINCDSHTIIAGAIEQSFIPAERGRYAGIITLDGCKDTSACITVMDPSGLQNVQESESVQLFPNPTHGLVYIKTAGIMQQATIRLTNILGQVISESYSQQGSFFNLDLTVLEKGIYVIEIQEGGKKMYHKILKL